MLSLHLNKKCDTDAAPDRHGPGVWRTKEEKWIYEYRLETVVIMSAPVIKA